MTRNTVPVTLNCSGGIALGSYMAGVFSELVMASLAPYGEEAEPLIRIDSITGASAGAMTGLIAARCLLQDPALSLRELADDGDVQAALADGHVCRNRFYRAWVELADLRRLLDYRAEERLLREQAGGAARPRTRLGLLSGEAIAGIAETVTGTWAEQDRSGMARALATRSLALLMTTTNLQGLLRGRSDHSLTVSHAETRRFLFHRSMPGLADDALPELNRRWSKAKESARASGAFPAAFPPISDSSDPGSANLALDPTSRLLYEQAALQASTPGRDPDHDAVCWMTSPQGAEPGDPGKQLRLRFDYTDGGVLDGLPILKGIELLERINAPAAETPPARDDDEREAHDAELAQFQREWQATALQEDARHFVYVQPIPVTDLSSSRSLLRRFFGLLATGLAGLTYPKAEHDHLRLEEIRRINTLVQRRDRLIASVGSDSAEATRLREVLPYRQIRLAAIDPVLTFRSPSFRDLLLEETAQATGAGVFEPARDEAEALARFESLLGKRSGKAAPGSGRLSASDLLATDFLGAFGGFFQERYRRHDYLMGRLSGLAWLHGLDPEGRQAATRATVRTLLQRAQRDYLPLEQRSGLRFPADQLRLLRLAAVRLPYVLLNDALAGRRGRHRPLRGWQRSLLRVVIAPLVGIVVLMVVPPLLASIVAVLLALGWLAGL